MFNSGKYQPHAKAKKPYFSLTFVIGLSLTGMEIFDKTLYQYQYCKEAMVNTQYQYQYCQVAKINTQYQYQYYQKAKANTQYQYQYL